MTQSEFLKLIREKLEAEGFMKIKVSPAIFSKKADIFARNREGKRCELKASLSREKGKEILRIEAVDGLEWINEIESLHAFFDE